MLISFYTSRVILGALGVSDYGIYNVVGGIVSMFSILTTSLSTSISRYITFELGKGDSELLSRVFSTSVVIQSIIAVLIVLITECLAIWFLNSKTNIPSERLEAANWVMHCSIAMFAIGLINVPFIAEIIAHERMDVFAYMSLFDALQKLIVAYAISISTIDRLKVYAFLLLMASAIVCALYASFCKKKFRECSFKYGFDRQLLKSMTGFAGWTLLGNGAFMFNTQGVNILINIFFGVTLNAARGVASQVESAIMQFVNNFSTALNPQITKSYAEGNLSYLHSLVCRGAKYSYFLTILFAIPICIETEQILTFWLKTVPDYAVDFVRLTFLTSIFTMIGNTLIVAQLATGRVKKYQITVTIWGLWVFPLTWYAFSKGGSPYWSYFIYAFIYFVLIFIRIYLVKDLIQLSWKKYMNEVMWKCFIVTVIALIPPLCIYSLQSASLIRVLEVCLSSILSTFICIYIVGIDAKERIFVRKQLARINGKLL